MSNIETIDEIKTDVKEILKMLNGNGKMGICAKVSVLWGSMIFLISGIASGIIITTIKYMAS